METSLIIALILISLSIYWILGNDEIVIKLLIYSISLFVTVVMALLIEKGFYAFSEVHYDQISIVYVLAIGLNVFLWAIIYIWQNLVNIPVNKLYRFSLLIFMGFLSGIIINIFFPEFFLGPLHGVDELYRRNRLAYINELQPIFSLSGFLSDSWLKESSKFLLWIGLIIPAFPMLFIFLLRRENPNKPFWVFITLGSLVFCPLAIGQIRWAPYLVIFIIPAYAWLVALIIDNIQWKAPGQLYYILRLSVLGVFIFCFYVPTSILAVVENEDSISFTSSTLKPMCDYLDNTNKWGNQPKNVLANPDFGPEILYRTKHNVFSIPNHRIQKGFTDTYRIFSASDSYSAFKIVKERGIDLILICPAYSEHKFYQNENSKAPFYDQLHEQRLPDWLRSVSLPSELSKNFSLFEVVH